MNIHYPAERHDATWRDVILEAAATILAFAIIAFATKAFCWSFLIPFHGRYAVGVILTLAMAKWLVFKNRK